MSDWDDACDPVQRVRKREDLIYRRGRPVWTRWQQRQIASGKTPGKFASLQGHDAAVEPDFDEGT